MSSFANKNLFTYCNNNPIARKDLSGSFWDTIFDVISLGASIVEVIFNPGDPTAWIGLAGDVVDLIPGVTGVGEIARTMRVADKAIDVTDNISDAARIIRKADNAPEAIKSATGTYEVIFQSGKNYVGKGGFSRAITSARNHADLFSDPVVSLRWVEAPNTRTAFEWEYILQQQRGVTHGDIGKDTYNIIFSPGKRYLDGSKP